MRRIITAVLAFSACICVYAQTPKNVKFRYTEGTELTLTGKMMPGTPNPYARVDTVRYKGFTAGENYQVRVATGMAIAFRTNSSVISVKTEYSDQGNRLDSRSTPAICYRGYDLYIKKDGRWLYAASGCTTRSKPDENLILVQDMDRSEHECLLYLPQYAEVSSVKIGVEDTSDIEALDNPFRHRIVVHGSSFTQGVCCTRSGMAYAAQLGRRTGLQMINFGCSGNCKMQPYFCDVLCDVEADAFVFDAFSNPDSGMIEERLVGFIDRLIEAHPGTPLIFQETIYRERRNFNLENDKYEAAKNKIARAIFAEMKSDREGRNKYKDVYLITADATNAEHDTSVDGIHPDNHGYYLWSKSIEKQLIKILSKYGIK